MALRSAFGPIGDSDIITLTSSSQRFSLGSLAGTNPAIRLIALNAWQSAWFLKFGDNAVTVSSTDGMRSPTASVDAPLIVPVPAGATHVAILAEGDTGDAQLSYGGFGDGEFSPIGASSTIAVTQSDQTVALPTLGTTGPAIRLVSANPSITSLYLKLGNGSVTADATDAMRVAPGSVGSPAIIPVTNGETHVAIFCDGQGGDVVMTGGEILGISGAAGVDAGLLWNFDSSTTMADPGTGDFRLNNATLASVTAAAFSDLCGQTGNPDVSAWVLSWDDSTNAIRGTLVIRKASAPSTFAIYNITGASTDNSGWTQLALTYVTSNGSFVNGDPCVASFARAGDASAMPRGHIFGLIVSNNATDANNDIDVAAGQARSDDNTADMTLAASITKRLDAAWAVGTGNGGLDTGTEAADTFYYVWLIKRTDTGVVDVLLSASATAPTMPANYTVKRRIGAIRNDGSSNILAFSQNANETDVFTYTTPILDVSVSNIGNARTLLTLTAPPSMTALIRASTEADSANNSIVLQPTTETDAVPALAASPLGTLSTTIRDLKTLEIPLNASSQIAARGSAANLDLNIVTRGWRDLRGRLN